MAAEGLSVKLASRVLDVTRAGFYAWKKRPLSPRAIRNVWLTDVITEIHAASRGTMERLGFMLSFVLGVGSLLATIRSESLCEALVLWVCHGGAVTRSVLGWTPPLLIW
jgi:hypothetical protein